MNDAKAIEEQLSDSEAHYSAAQPFTGAQWSAIQAMGTHFASLDAVVIHDVPHSDEQSAARDLLKSAHEKVLAALVEYWVEPESITYLTGTEGEGEAEPEPEPEPDPEGDGAGEADEGTTQD